MDNNTTNKNTVEFDIHGIVGIRVVNPSEYDIKYISTYCFIIYRHKYKIFFEEL